MHISRFAIAVALVGSTLALDAPAARADLTVNSWNLGTAASDGTVGDAAVDNTIGSPFSLASTASAGGSSSTTTYGFDYGAGGGSFNWEFDHQRAGATGSGVSSFAVGANLSFTITGENMLYDLSGAYSMMGGQTINAFVQLFDTTMGSQFVWEQLSNSSLDESFVVGQGGDGDAANTLIGNQFGTLLAGHTYTLQYSFGINNVGLFDDAGASANGFLQMDISAATVPVPGAALLAMLGLPMVGWMKRRLS